MEAIAPTEACAMGYSLRDWNTNPPIANDQFTFSAPEGATQLETLPANELAEFTSTEEGQL